MPSAKPKNLEFIVDVATKDQRLDKFLSQSMESIGASRRKIRDHIEQGSVYIDGKRVHIASREVQDNQKVLILWQPVVGKYEKQKSSLNAIKRWQDIVLFEDQDIVAINKPRGLACQATRSNSKEHVIPWLQKLGGPELLLAHRIDQWTSGVLLLAKTKTAQQNCMEFFKRREGKSEQSLGVSPGKWSEQVHFLLKPDQSTMKVTVVGPRDKRAKEAILKVRELDSTRTNSNTPLCLLEVKPETGRTHQIRVQLAAVDLPIIGDSKYGKFNCNAEALGIEGDLPSGQLLHAQQLIIPRLKLKATAPYPEDWDVVLKTFVN